MESSISSNLWRILWRERGFQWLREEKKYHDIGPDSCIRILRDNPAKREAAFALFWGTYLGTEQPPTLADQHIEEVKHLFENGHPGAVGVEDMPNIAFVKLHLAGALAVCLIRPDYPTYENTSLVAILERAIEAYYLSQPPELDLDDPKAWGKELADKDLFGFSTILLSGIIRIELASIRVSQMRYEDALSHISEGAWDICATTIEQATEYSAETGHVDFHNNGFLPYLPHLGHEFDIQEAADIFEEIKKHPKDINDWGSVKLYCDVLKYLGYIELYDGLLDDITDSSGEEFVAGEYWGKAITFAEQRMQIISSPFHILTKEKQERAETEDRLKRDFLSENWRELPGESLQKLVDAEIAWIHGRLGDMMKEFRPFLEMVLPSIFIFLRPTTRERGDPRLPLTVMRDGIKGKQIIQASIRGLKIQEHDKQWVIGYLPTFLNEVIGLRNYFEKERLQQKSPETEEKMRDKAISVRRTLLGIGCEGVLPQLLEIKKICNSSDKKGSE
ncbi:MAG: hypothetical protein WB564_06190 [Dehalococcoidia bacterium]